MRTRLQVCRGCRCALDWCTGRSGQWATAGPLVALQVAQSVEIREFGTMRSRFRTFGCLVQMVGTNSQEVLTRSNMTKQEETDLYSYRNPKYINHKYKLNMRPPEQNPKRSKLRYSCSEWDLLYTSPDTALPCTTQHNGP